MFEKEKFEKICQIKIDNVDLYIEAMTHRSYLNENKNHPHPHNERLEFLGDAVLELVVTEHLFNNFNNPEGEMTAWRASLVNGEMLAQVAREIGVEPFLMMSKGEAKDTGRARNYLLANSIESIIGAIYNDKGYEESKKFIESFIIIHLDEILEKKLYLDPKSYFQEKAQQHEDITPHYEVVGESGPDHDKKYIVGVFLKKEKIAEGEGISKQDAQREAARIGLEVKSWV
ncbi:MAG: ribonuclease III [Candidatus Moranbacteria bacterium]|nr:ribonuclease III [Candidatus Moranbacteria bacterium]